MTDSDKISIHLLQDRPEFLDACIAWNFSEWSCHVQGVSLEDVRTDYLNRLEDDDLPLLWVAILGDKPVGMVSLKQKGIKRDDLTPWLGSLYVHVKYRGHGFGDQLIEHVEQEAKRRGYGVLHIFSSMSQSFWDAKGWTKIDTVIDPMDAENNAPIMMKAL